MSRDGEEKEEEEEEEKRHQHQHWTLYWINFQVLFPLGRLIIAGVNGMCYTGTAVWPFGNATHQKCQVHAIRPLRLPMDIYKIYMRAHACWRNRPFIKWRKKAEKRKTSSHVRHLTFTKWCVSAIRSHFFGCRSLDCWLLLLMLLMCCVVPFSFFHN